MPEDPGSVFLAPSIDQREVTCPACGATFPASPRSSPDQTITTLLAVCDVLVVKALEKMGSQIIRGDKGRYDVLHRRPHHMAHTLWPVTDEIVSRSLKDAWNVVPLLLETHGPDQFDAELVITILDEYVHDLAVSGSEHSINDMAFRIRSGLGLPVFHVGHAPA